MPSAPRPDPPYLRIVAEISGRIRSGDLRPGERMPSIRQIADRWEVAVATATRAVATLRDQGLVETKVGSGTIVSTRLGRRRPTVPKPTPTPARPGRRGGASQQVLTREHLIRAAIAIADAEGLDAVSMRRVAADLGVGPMSLYRHVETKDELVIHMADEVFGEADLPTAGPDGWRAKLELIARRQWALCWRHLWLPQAVSFTRPLLVPTMMAHTEWTLRALDGLGLSTTTRMREALTLHSFVLTIAMSMANEVAAEQETGVTLSRWLMAQRTRTEELLASGRFPELAKVHEETTPDLNGLFEFGLARHLDGFAALVRDSAD